ncbi:undecaprenyl-diphosphatase [Candidatus Photodesmus blepharus]|uniref:Undecaprenyl-diphosphatase n=1 Tax=Candidatus Photodesmus blepharonis TaxID=1179155 RepID=A0A084CMR7_9GAMM|nr:undecaprenyl-diphosphate phosphatase [Candidatus Photodesmus blepharus]KEY91096.1 undecaprenyl-diphosphatase [Candidatus Photodesmus blepharus]
MNYFEVFLLALIQGFTEFLPISSSAHLILPSIVFNWQDQGLLFDVAMHMGTLAAVIIYFRQEIVLLFESFLTSILLGDSNKESKLFLMVILSSVPACIFGLFIEDIIELYLRNVQVVAINTVFFGLLLWYVANNVSCIYHEYEIDWKKSLFIGISQALAVIPGVSRSGITITAALYLGFTYKASIRFSFLMSIPVIMLASAYLGLEFVTSEEFVRKDLLLIGVLTSFTSAYICIHFFLKLVNSIGITPFVIYRLILGFFLFAFLFLN